MAEPTHPQSIITNQSDHALSRTDLASYIKELEETIEAMVTEVQELRRVTARMAGREYMIRDLENENKLLRLRLEMDCGWRQPDI